MATMKHDWAEAAARSIMLKYDLNEIAPQDLSVYALSAVIRDHVPRCDQCKHWDKDKRAPDEGACSLMLEPSPKIWPDYRDGINTKADFGCVEWEKR